MIKHYVSNRVKRKANLVLLEPSTKMKEQRSRTFQTPGLIVFTDDDDDRVKIILSHVEEILNVLLRRKAYRIFELRLAFTSRNTFYYRTPLRFDERPIRYKLFPLGQFHPTSRVDLLDHTSSHLCVKNWTSLNPLLW